MIGKLRRFLGQVTAAQADAASDGLPLAVAALLAEAAGMDASFDRVEREAIARVLARRFSLSPVDAAQLTADGVAAADRSAQLFRFTQTVVTELPPERRAEIIETLWEVAYADGELAPEEDQLIRRVAGLIHVPDRERGEARKRALERLGIAP